MTSQIIPFPRLCRNERRVAEQDYERAKERRVEIMRRYSSLNVNEVKEFQQACEDLDRARERWIRTM